MSDEQSENARNVTTTLEAVRVVSEVPRPDGLMSLERAFSASSFESMHSIDHGSLGVDSCMHQQASDISQEGPWTIYTRKPDPPACYQATYKPAMHPFPRPKPSHPWPESASADMDHHEACASRVDHIVITGRSQQRTCIIT